MKKFAIIFIVTLLVVNNSGFAQRFMEKLDRGVVALAQRDGSVFLSWRLLASDPPTCKFHVYRNGGNGWERITKKPLSDKTNFIDRTCNLSNDISYQIQVIYKGVLGEKSDVATIESKSGIRSYFSVPIQKPENGEVDGERYSYSANDASVGDLDGDGTYEIILKWDPSNSKRPPQSGFTGHTFLDAYRLDGTRLWRIDLGKNIRSGAAYTQFLVYDLNCDGKAELVCKTADGTVDGAGTVIGDKEADWRGHDIDLRKFYGRIVDGPEYLTVFDGITGVALDTKEYLPNRYPLDGWGGIGGNGGNDTIGSRANRMTAGVAYLDGVTPSVVFVRGWYGRTVVAAWDFKGADLISKWTFDSALPQWKGYSGMANHQLTVADLDDDGKDEICVGAMVVDDDGSGLYTTGLRHGDALHVSDLNPKHKGLEVYGIHENEGRTIALQTPGAAMFDGATGDVLWQNNLGIDVGRGLAADIDPRYIGAECWGAPGGLRKAIDGKVITKRVPRTCNFAIWWDGDLLRELLDKTSVYKWNWKSEHTDEIFKAEGVRSNNGSKHNPCLQADMLGDWREEIIWSNNNSTELRIYTTTTPSDYRFVTLMHNPQYRLSVAWQNVAYNQPPHPSFYLGSKMKKVRPIPIRYPAR